ncbi:MAG: ATP-binding protein [Gemmatimonadota bacterium]|jgi:signal transduction histidine kinase
MSRWRPRFGTLAVLIFIGSSLIGLLVVQSASKRFLRDHLPISLSAAEAQGVVDDFGRAFIAFAVTAIFLGAVVAGVAGVKAGSIVRGLRRDTLRRARGSRGPFERPPIAELNGLASAIERLAADLEARVDGANRERNELAVLVQSVSEGILLAGPAGRILHANPAARILLSLPPDFRDQPLASLIRHGDLRRIIDDALAGDAPTAEIDLDDRRLLVVTRRVTASEAGTPSAAGFVVSLVDLTQVRRLEGVRRDFVANVSHEIKTPLTSIRGYVETLQSDEPEPEVRRQFLTVIQKNADRLQQIVDDLLDLSRIESGGWEPDFEDVDPVRIATETWDGFSVTARERGVTLTTPDAGPLVRADVSALRHIFGNLFDNAIRHTPDGGTVSVTARHVDAGPNGPPCVTIEVRDTGAGIPSESLPRIFERFYRADPARSRAEGGTGLGLSIVKHLTESMDGEASASSELGKGTTVRVRLPAAPVRDGSG